MQTVFLRHLRAAARGSLPAWARAAPPRRPGPARRTCWPAVFLAEYGGGSCCELARERCCTSGRGSASSMAGTGSGFAQRLALGVVGGRSPTRAGSRLRRSSASASRYCCSRVALPTHSTRSPVAAGSRVPVWPMRRSRRARRAACTTSCEVGPAGLSTSRSPVEIGAHAFSRCGHHRAGKRACRACVKGASATVHPAALRWPPPPKRAGDRLHVHDRRASAG